MHLTCPALHPASRRSFRSTWFSSWSLLPLLLCCSLCSRDYPASLATTAETSAKWACGQKVFSFWKNKLNQHKWHSLLCSPVWHLGLHTQTQQRKPKFEEKEERIKLGSRQQSEAMPRCRDATCYLKTILLCKLDDGFSPFPGGVCRIKNRNLSSFFCEILSNVVQRSRSALSVKRRNTSKEKLPKWRYLTEAVCVILPSDLQPLFIVWTEELKGLVDLHIVSPVLPNVELYAKEEKRIKD